MSGTDIKTAFSWPDAAVKTLREMKAAGHASSAIAKALSLAFKHPITRNAVIGKSMRLGIETMTPARMAETVRKGSGLRVKKKFRASKPKPEAVIQRRAADLIRHEKAKAAKTAEVVQHPVHPDLIAMAPAGIMDLRHDSCRWPMERTTDDGDALFCCNTKAASGSYCEGHAKRAYSKTQTPQQKAEALRKAEANTASFRARGGWHSDAFGFGLSKRAG